jgi:hypothetical protein
MRLAIKTTVLAAVAAVVLAVATSATDAASIRFTVIKAENQKPVRNASVIIHPVSKDGRQQKGGVELKTDAEGAAKVDGIPYGRMRIQVIAPGLQTYGEDYDIKQAEQEFLIKMNRPKSQMTIYK